MKNPQKRWIRAEIEALALHALIFGLGYWVFRESKFPLARVSGPIEVQLEASAPKVSASRRSDRSKAQPSPAQKPAPALQLGPRYSFTPGGQATAPSANSSESGNGSGPPRDGYEQSNLMGIEEESKLYPFFTALWKKVDMNTGYPEDFVKERVTGYVTAQLEVDRRGVFTGKIVKVSSDQTLLEAYALAVLFHALSEPLPRALWSDREQTILVSRFDFRTFTYGEIVPERRQKELKNVLEFERYGYNDPKLKQVIEQIVTHYLPPIIPVPGGFYIDFIYAYRLINNMSNNKLEEADLRLERIELKREQLENIVHKDSQGAPGLGVISN